MATSEAYAHYFPQAHTDADYYSEIVHRLEKSVTPRRTQVPVIMFNDLELYPLEIEDEAEEGFKLPVITVLEEKQNKALQIEAMSREQAHAEIKELYSKLSPALYSTIAVLSFTFFVVCVLEGLYLYSLSLGFLAFVFGALAFSKAYIRRHIKRSWRQIQKEG